MKNTFFGITLLMLLCIGSVVAAENGTLYFDDAVEMDVGFSSSSSDTETSYANGLYSKNIESLQNLDKIYLRIYDTAAFSPTADSDDFFLSDVFSYTGTISGDTVMSGDVTIINHLCPDSSTMCNEIEYIFDISYWDITGHSGACGIQILIPDFGALNPPYTSRWIPSTTSGSLTHRASGDLAQVIPDIPNGGLCLYEYYSALSRVYPATGPKILVQTTMSGEIHQSVLYTIESDYCTLEYLRNGYTNLISIISNDDEVYYYKNSDEDFTTIVYNKSYIELLVSNPLTGVPWIQQIPDEASAEPDLPSEQSALINSYVYDAVTRNLIGNGHNVTVDYDSGSSTDTWWPGAIDHTTIDWSDDVCANITYSADGYQPITNQWSKFFDMEPGSNCVWLKVGEEIESLVYLMPDGTPTNTTAYVTFEVQEQLSGDNYFYSSGAAVSIGNTTLITGGMGTCNFELSSGTYSYTVSKQGFQTTSGSFTLGSSNQYIGVDLPKMPSAPTPTSTGEAGVDYPYSDVDPYQESEEAMGIIFDNLTTWAALASIVITMSFIGWMKPKR